MLTAYEIYKFEKVVDELGPVDKDAKGVYHEIKNAGVDLVASGDIRAAVLGAGTIGTVLGGSMKTILELYQNPLTKGSTKTFLNSGVVTFASFAGWEFGMHLVEMARYMIVEPNPNNSDIFEASERYAQICLMSLISPDKMTSVESEVIRQMWNNMSRILQNDEVEFPKNLGQFSQAV